MGARVKLPELSPSEFSLLVLALRFFHDSEKDTVLDKETDLGPRNEARANAVRLQALLDKIG